MFNKKSKQVFATVVCLLFFLVAGLTSGHLMNDAVAAPPECSYAYCSSNGNCKTNQNMTNCMSPDGQLPCTDSEPCNQ